MAVFDKTESLGTRRRKPTAGKWPLTDNVLTTVNNKANEATHWNTLFRRN